jgi:hypothetical protein
LTWKAHFPTSLRAMLTSNSIIKFGYQVKQTLSDIACVFNDSEIHNSLKSTTSLIELGQHAKLKGIVQNPLISLPALAGTILKKSLTPFTSTSNGWHPGYIRHLHEHIECIWQMYLSLREQDSIGLPLIQAQAQAHGQLVTLFHSQKPVAEGYIIWPHSGFLNVVKDDHGTMQRLNITPTRSLIQLTQILTPGYIHSPHKQCLQWIFNHEKQAVVYTSALRSRGTTSPLFSSPLDYALSTPAPSTAMDNSEDTFTLSISSNGEVLSEVEPQPDSFSDSESDVDIDESNGAQLLGEEVFSSADISHIVLIYSIDIPS